MTERKGGWLQTYTGRQFWPLDPRAEEVCIEDIAHSLSLQCRFAGHCREFYSVAEHSVRVSLALEGRGFNRDVQLWGLLHDASEAYLVDLPRPVKRHMAEYRAAEEPLQDVIMQRFGVAWPHPAVRRWADDALLATEARDLMGAPPAPWVAMPDPLPDVIVLWAWQRAKVMFLSRFAELGGQQ